MSNSKHTQGEWYLISKPTPIPTARKGQHRVSVASDKSDTLIGKIIGRNEVECEANAKLVAAAPEMLEALIDIRKWYEENQNKYLGESTPICFSKVLSVIKKVNI